MRFEKVIRRGDEIRCMKAENQFVTRIIGFTSEDTFTADLPSTTRIIRIGDIFNASCLTDTGIHNFEVQIIESQDPQSMHCLNMKITKYRSMIQRRETFRVAENLYVEICRFSAERTAPCKWYKTTTLNVSEMGMLVKFDEPCDLGQTMNFNLYIDTLGINTHFNNLYGRVVRCVEVGKKKEYLLGINFTNLPEKARADIMRLVVLSQRDSLAHKKFKEVSRLWEKRS